MDLMYTNHELFINHPWITYLNIKQSRDSLWIMKKTSYLVFMLQVLTGTIVQAVIK